MLLSYKYRLYPNPDQRQTLNRILETHRQVYNAALQERRDAWKRCGISIRYTDQANQLKEIRSFDADIAWCNYSSLQQTLRRLNKAFEAFFRRVRAARTFGSPNRKFAEARVPTLQGSKLVQVGLLCLRGRRQAARRQVVRPERGLDPPVPAP